MSLAYIANTFSSPLVHVPVCICILWGLKKLNFHPKLCTWLIPIPVVWLYICSLVYPSAAMIKHLEDQFDIIPISSEKWKQTDAIVVLACYYFDDKNLPFVSRWPNCSLQRNLHATLMYKKHPLPIYLAGASLGKNNPLPIAEYNRSFFENLGIQSNDIYTVPDGRNTESEVEALAPLLKDKYISLVTSASHMPRAVQYFKSHDIKVLPIPVDHLSNTKIEPMLGKPNARSLHRSEKAIHEYLGLIYQRFIY